MNTGWSIAIFQQGVDRPAREKELDKRMPRVTTIRFRMGLWVSL